MAISVTMNDARQVVPDDVATWRVTMLERDRRLYRVEHQALGEWRTLYVAVFADEVDQIMNEHGSRKRGASPISRV